MLRSRGLVLFLLLVVGTVSASRARGEDDARQKALELQKKAIACHEGKDWKCFLESSRQAEALLPGNLRLVYNLACAESLTGDFAGAAKHLALLLDRQLDLGIEGDEDLAPLRAAPEYAPVAQRLAALQTPVSTSTVAFRLPQKDLLTEGIAFDPKTRAFYVSSVHHRKIVRRNPDGTVVDFVPEGRDGLEAVLALRADPKRRLLWACSAALPEMAGYEKTVDGSSSLFAFDLATGRLVRRVALPKEGKRALNDLAIAENGDVYATDSLGGGLYRLKAGADSLETVVPPSALRSPQGVGFVPGAREKRAFVAEYGTGIWSVDLGNGEKTPVGSPPDVPLQGVDGLVVHGDELVVTQNGIRPIRVARLKLDASSSRVVRAEIIEKNSPLLDEPTLGVVAGNDFYYIANPQWGSFDKEGKMFPLEKLSEPTILKVSLR
jgi:sugar lactone lactonase YvrE